MPYTLDASGQKVPIGGKTAKKSSAGGLDLQQILLFAALSDPKHASWYSAINQLGQPSAAKVKKEESQKDVEQFTGKIDRAIQLLQNKKITRTGQIAGRLLGMKVSVLGTANKEERELYNLISEIEAKKLFEIGGKVLPAQEINRLIPFLPATTNPVDTNVTNLELLKQGLSGGVSTPSTTQPATNEEDEYELAY